MTNGYAYHLNNQFIPNSVNFKGETSNVTKPSEDVVAKSDQTPKTNISTTKEPDTFIKKIEKEKEKKSTKKALAAGGVVLVAGSLITLLNPKNSSKLLQKLKTLQTKNKIKLETKKQNFLKTKFGQFLDKSLDIATRAVRATGNFNNGKDILYKNICSNKRQYNGVKNKTLRNGLRKVNDVFTGIMTKINNGITKGFDTVGQATVKGKYKKATNSMNEFEVAIKRFKSQLPSEQQKLVDEKLAEIAKHREFFSEANLAKRFKVQETGMADLHLEEKVNKKITNFFNGYKGQKSAQGVWEHTDKNLTLWSEDILRPHRDMLEKEGHTAVSKLFGGEKDKKGLYDEILDITRTHLSAEDQKLLQEARSKSAKKLRNANTSECIDYYDKKRDLILGSAPTDILTGVVGLGVGSIAIATSDSKEERKAKLFGNTTFPLIPTILGVGVSVAMTAMLFSGATGLLVGFGVTTLLSKLGSLVNKHVFKYDEDAIHEAKMQAKKEKQAAREAERLARKNNKDTTQEAINV